MSNGKKWDLTTKNSLDGASRWILKDSGAILVLIVRGEDMSFAVDDSVAPADAAKMVDYVLPELQEQLDRERRLAKEEGTRKRLEAEARHAASEAKKREKETRTWCSCAHLVYRNDSAGRRHEKIQGEASCAICQGYGSVSTCVACDGAGLQAGQKCAVCFGFGLVPYKESQR